MSFINPVKNTIVHVVPHTLDNGINKTLCAFFNNNYEYRHVVLDLMTTVLDDIKIQTKLAEHVLSGADSYMYYTGDKINIPNIRSVLIHDSIWIKDINISDIINTDNCNVIRYSQLAELPLVVVSNYITLVSSHKVPTIDFSQNYAVSQYVNTDAIIAILDGVANKFNGKFRAIISNNNDPESKDNIKKIKDVANKHNNITLSVMPYYIDYDTQIQPNTDIHISMLKENHTDIFSYNTITAAANKKLSITNSTHHAIKDIAYITNNLNDVINLVCDTFNNQEYINNIIHTNHNSIFKISDVAVCYKLNRSVHNSI
jgi:hypothetical protein